MEKNFGKFFEETIKELVKNNPNFPPSWETELEKQEPTIKPTVIIGLGTSGVYCVSYIKRRINQVYKGPLAYHKEPIKYLIMDTVSWQGILQEFPEIDKIISQDEYLFLGGFIPSSFIAHQMDNTDLLDWFPIEYTNKIPGVTIDDGARGIGLLGRLALYHHKEKVMAEITNAVNETGNRREDLVRDGKLAALPDGLQQDIYVYIIGGSYGGTARGILLDIVYLCNSAIINLGKIPRINLILVMPRIACEYNRKKGHYFRVNAIKASSHAFFKELQYFCAEGKNNIDDWRFNPSTKEKFSECFINNIFLFDTEIRGTDIDKREELFNLISEYVFNCICAPVGSNIAQRRADMLEQLSKTCRGKPASFSSAGISFLSYPSVSFTRIISAKMIYEILQKFLRSELSHEENEETKKDAQRFIEKFPNYLNAQNIDNELVRGTEHLWNQINPTDILASSQKASICREKVDEGERLLKNGFDIIEDNFKKLKEVALREINEKLKESLVDFVFEKPLETKEKKEIIVLRSIEYQKTFLRNILSMLENLKIKAKKEKEKWDSKEANLCAEIEKLEKAFFVLSRQRKITEKINQLVEAINAEIKEELYYKAYEKRKEFVEDCLIPLIKDYIEEKIEFFKNVIEKIRNEMKNQMANYQIYEEEYPVPTTTQIIPCSLESLNDDKGIKDFCELIGITLEKPEKFSPHILSLIDKEFLKRLLEKKISENEMLRLLAEKVVEKLTEVFNKNVSQIIEKMLSKDEKTIKERWQKFIYWSDPCWYVFEGRLPPERPSFTDQEPKIAIPINSPEVIKSTFNNIDTNIKSLDPRLIVAIREAHAYPLFAIRDIGETENEYNKAIDDYKNAGGAPPHIRSSWNADPTSLSPISPEITPTPIYKQALAIGLFLDWLIRIQKDERLLKLMEPPEWSHTGPIYVEVDLDREDIKGDTKKIEKEYAKANTYKYVAYKWEKGKFMRPYEEGGAVLTNRGRNEALNKLDQEKVKTIQQFYENLSQAIPELDIPNLMREYINFLIRIHKLEVSLLQETNRAKRAELLKNKSPREREFKLLLCDEIDILQREMQEMYK